MQMKPSLDPGRQPIMAINFYNLYLPPRQWLAGHGWNDSRAALPAAPLSSPLVWIIRGSRGSSSNRLASSKPRAVPQQLASSLSLSRSVAPCPFLTSHHITGRQGMHAASDTFFLLCVVL